MTFDWLDHLDKSFFNFRVRLLLDDVEVVPVAEPHRLKQIASCFLLPLDKIRLKLGSN